MDQALSRGKALGVSNIRFLPKATSLRLITNLGSAAKTNPPFSRFGTRETKAVNTQLLNLFYILKFVKVWNQSHDYHVHM